MSFTRVLIGSAEKPKRSFRWSLVSVRQQDAVMKLCSQSFQLKKTMFRVGNRIASKGCLLISKITLKTSERRRLTTSYFPEVTVQSHIWDSFFQIIYQSAIKSLLSVLLSSSKTRNFNNSIPICHFMGNEKSLPKYLIHEKP